MLTNQQINDDWNWVKNTFTITLGTDFESYKEIIANSAMDETFSKTTSPVAPDAVKNMLNEIGESGALPVYFSKRKCRDTSLGGNDAINCYYQFNETDDVTHPFLQSNFGNARMGRYYSEAIDDSQQIMYLSFGVPDYNNLASYFTDAIVSQLAQLMNTGETFGINEISRLVGLTAGTILTLPVMPLIFINRVLGGLRKTKVTKYYDFKSTMPLYYRCVNSIIQHLAVNMGLANDGFASNIIKAKDQSVDTGSKTSSMTPMEQMKTSSATNNTNGLPDIFKTAGFDIYKIMCKKYVYMNGDDLTKIKSSDQTLIDELKTTMPPDKNNTSTVKTFFENAITQFTGSLYDAQLYVGFRVEKSVDTSETLSNQTGESSIAQMINSKVQAIRDAKFNLMNGNLGDGVISEAVKSVFGAITNLAKGASEAVDLGSLTETLSGNGIYDIPEVWKSSSFDKSYSFTLSLRTPYGDPWSIMQSLYIPLALILGGALPRAVGPTTYTSPFICRAYCKGMFSVSQGLIDNITIKRGSDQHGWNYQRLPTCIDVTFSIKDLSPAMYLAVADSESWLDVFGSNSTFQEYLLTLSGIGLGERLLYFQNLRRKTQYLLNIMSTEKLSPFYWGLEAGNTTVGRVISAVLPNTKIPSN